MKKFTFDNKVIDNQNSLPDRCANVPTLLVFIASRGMFPLHWSR